jgi:hypothetical protein
MPTFFNNFIMKKILFIFFLFFTEGLYGQDLKKNAINLGLLGNNPLIGLNYERKFLLADPKKGFLSAGIGLDLLLPVSAAISKSKNEDYFLLVFFLPHHITYNFGEKNHFFEAGYAGIAAPETFILPGVRLGYRYESDKQWQYRVYTNPLFTRQAGLQYTSLFGLSLGRSF